MLHFTISIQGLGFRKRVPGAHRDDEILLKKVSLVEACRDPAQDWPLRVTLVYCREGVEWRLAHRHADPLVTGVSLKQAAALARGEAT